MNYRTQVEWLDTDYIESPFFQRISAWIAVLSAVGLILFLFTAGYTRKESVRGVLVPAGGLIDISPISGGRIVSLSVKEGDLVEQGELIATISNEMKSDLLAQMLGMQLQSNQATIQAREDLSGQDLRRNMERIRFLRQKLLHLDQEISNSVAQLNGNQQMLDRLTPLLEDGFISGIEVQRMQDSVTNLRSQRLALDRQRIDVLDELRAEEESLNSGPLEHEIQKRDLEQQRREIEQQIYSNDSQSNIEVRAPAAGVITAINVDVNQVVQQGSPIAAFSPAGSKLGARLLVPSSAVGFVEVGQKVSLKYDAYPSQIFGTRVGHVTAISRSALMANQASEMSGVIVNDPVFRVDVEIEEQSFTTRSGTWNLRPGMQLGGDVQLERRTLINWIFTSGRDALRSKQNSRVGAGQ